MNNQQILHKLERIALRKRNIVAMRSELYKLMAEIVDATTESADEKFPEEMRNEISIRDGFTCTYCHRAGSPLADPDGNTWTVDHVVPYSRGGITSPENGTLSCRACNCAKGNKTPVELLHTLDSSQPIILIVKKKDKTFLDRVRLLDERKPGAVRRIYNEIFGKQLAHYEAVGIIRSLEHENQ